MMVSTVVQQFLYFQVFICPLILLALGPQLQVHLEASDRLSAELVQFELVWAHAEYGLP
jgi:hypothetical protein